MTEQVSVNDTTDQVAPPQASNVAPDAGAGLNATQPQVAAVQEAPAGGKAPQKTGDTVFKDLDTQEDVKPVTLDRLPDNWRELMAGGDEKKLSQLQRFKSPGDYANAYFEAQNKLRSGEYKKASPPENATPEQMKAWREDQGLPSEASAYEISGLNMAGADDLASERVAKLQKAAYDGKLSKDSWNNIVKAYNDIAEEAKAEQVMRDASNRDTCEDRLRQELGAMYRPSLAMVKRHLGTRLGDLADDILNGARLSDGRRLSDIPDVVNYFLNAATAMDGEVAMPAVGMDRGGKSVADEIAEIENIMRTDLNKYNAQHRDRYAQLLKIREKRGEL